MHKLFKYIILTTLSFILLSCGSGTKRDADTVTDSIPTDSLGHPILTFKNSQEILDYMKKSPDWKKYQAGILPQMAKDVKDYAEKLLNNHHDNFIIVDKAKMKVFLYDKYGRVIKSYGMACSRNYGTKHRDHDNCTAEGFFSVKGIFDSSDWLYTDDFGNTSQARGQFGPKFIRVNVPNTNSIGIHGTASPGSIGGRRSHGCIRLTNENILDLAPRVEVGVPIIISPGPKDMAYNEYKGCYIPSVSTEPGSPRAVKADKVPTNYYPTPPAKRAATVAKDSVRSNAPSDVAIETGNESAAPAPAPAPASETPAPSAPAQE